MANIALLGETFDNAAYVPPGESVLWKLRQRLPQNVKVTLAARDGSHVHEIATQLGRLPSVVTHLVVSVGGNDALAASRLLRENVQTIGDAVLRLSNTRRDFARAYESILVPILERGVPTAVATIYEPHFAEPDLAVAVAGGLPLFNDAITRLCFRSGLTLLDLRLICNEAGDFTSGIEPSAQGSNKIASVVARFFGERRDTSVSLVYS